ncbi:LysR family transcriptional regulator [Actinokineospora sp. PR83]|uniref:LysR family transcriptional regulator n=1 Tax=Actinokineospora sp. PR83 TaxID=2884908 RepID=UPI001F201511|nr:LysR family transcriptional regulator [Actinokineospora sp. PR83]MCG8919765.1 LysR family transcriptional regulator [Actinokineospora sp. PR83]
MEFLVAVAETQHFGRAAERVGVGLEEMTRWSREVERETGLGLFERTVRRVRLTETGTRLEAGALAALAAVRGVSTLVESLRHGWSGSVALAYVPGSAHLVRGLVARVERDRVGLEVEPQSMWGVRALGSLGRGEVSFAVVRDPLPEEGVESLVLGAYRDRQVAVASPGPLAGREQIGLAEFEGQGFLLTEREVGPAVHDATVRFLAEHGVAPVWRHHRLQEQDQQLALVAAGVGSALVHPHEDEALHPGVAVVPLREQGPEHRFHLVWRADDASPLVTAVITAAEAMTTGRRPVQRG